MKTKLSIAILGVILVISGLWFVMANKAVIEPDTKSTWKTYASEKVGITFTYPDKYFLEERELGDGHKGHLAIILTEDTKENQDVRESKAPGRDGPVAITFDFYQSPDESSILQWVKENKASNFTLSNGTYVETTLASKPAISYSWDGLYQADNIVVAHQDFIASIVVTYITPEDQIRKDFQEIIKTIELK